MKNILFISLIVVSLTAISYAEQIPMPKPVTDCKATLEAWGNPPNCYCSCDTCRPVCTEPEKPEPEKDKQSSNVFFAQQKKHYECYWQAECFGQTGGYAITDGVTFGQFENHAEAESDCKRDAERSTRGYGGNCFIKCGCWEGGMQPFGSF